MAASLRYRRDTRPRLQGGGCAHAQRDVARPWSDLITRLLLALWFALGGSGLGAQETGAQQAGGQEARVQKAGAQQTVAQQTVAQEAGARPGPQRFEIRSAYVERVEHVYQLNTTIDLHLPQEARAAIVDGAPLTLSLDIVVRRQRSYWPNDTVAALSQNYALSYHALSERYLVRNLNSGEQTSYATLDAALDELRVIGRLPILDQALIRPDSRHEISLRASLDIRTMPDTLRFLLFWVDDWRQRTEWYTWSPQL